MQARGVDAVQRGGAEAAEVAEGAGDPRRVHFAELRLGVVRRRHQVRPRPQRPRQRQRERQVALPHQQHPVRRRARQPRRVHGALGRWAASRHRHRGARRARRLALSPAAVWRRSGGGGEVPQVGLLASQQPPPRRSGPRTPRSEPARAPRSPHARGGGPGVGGGGGGGREVTWVAAVCPLPSQLQPGAMLLGVMRCCCLRAGARASALGWHLGLGRMEVESRGECGPPRGRGAGGTASGGASGDVLSRGPGFYTNFPPGRQRQASPAPGMRVGCLHLGRLRSDSTWVTTRE